MHFLSLLFLPFLIKISVKFILKNDGFKLTEKCSGTNISTPQRNRTQTQAKYTKGNKSLNLIFLGGFLAFQTFSTFQNTKIENDKILIETTKYNNYKCIINYNKKEKNGAIIILLNSNMQKPKILTLEFKNCSIEEAKNLLNKINLNKFNFN